MNRNVTFANRSILTEAYACGERLLAEAKERLKAVEQSEPGELSIAQLAKYEDVFTATVRQIEESQSCFKRMVEAKTEEEFDTAQAALAAWRQLTPRFAAAKCFGWSVK